MAERVFRARGYKAVRSYKDAGREREKVWLSALSVFCSYKRAALSDNRTQIYTDYHGIVKHEVTSLCVGGGKGSKRKKRENEEQREGRRRPFIFPINPFYCHLNLSLCLQMTSRQLMWNNK